MSKPVKELVRKELMKRFQGVDSMAVVGFTGLDAVMTHTVRGRLLEKGVRMTVVKNSVARQAFREMGLAKAADMLDGPCAVAYGADPKTVGVVSVVRSILEIGKDAPQLTVKAALLEGEIFGQDRIEELSRFPTRDEAISRLLSCALSPGRKLAACLIGPGGRLAGIFKTIEDKRKEAGEGAPAAETTPEVQASPAPETPPTAEAAGPASPGTSDAPSAPAGAPSGPAASAVAEAGEAGPAPSAAPEPPAKA